MAQPLYTVAHHGACEATDHCGVSPNTIESISPRRAHRLERRRVGRPRHARRGPGLVSPIRTLSRSLVRGLFCNGAFNQLSLAELRGACMARYGEQIPTLEAALDMMIKETELEGAYLDEKTADGVLESARLVAYADADMRQRNATNDASEKDRKFSALIGIPTDEVLDAGAPPRPRSKPNSPRKPRTPGAGPARARAPQVPARIRRRQGDCRAVRCLGPTWTSGPQPENVQKLRDHDSNT